MKKILIIIDGGADLPCIKGKTPFEAARTPNLDYLAKNGKMGYMYPIGKGKIPESDESVFTILGQKRENYPGRGIIEAYGSGLKIKKGDLALRANFATINNKRELIDRRVGRTLKTKEAMELAEYLNKNVKLNYNFKFKSTVQHRGVLVIRGWFSDNISSNDPEYGNKRLLECEPLDETKLTKDSTNIVNSFINQSIILLKDHPINVKRKKEGKAQANFILVRGAGTEVKKLIQMKDWAAIAGMPAEKGIATLSGMKLYDFKYPEFKGKDIYSNLYDGLKTELDYACKYLPKEIKKYSGVYIHIKNTDVPGHDGKCLDKKSMIEIIDKTLINKVRKLKNVIICITCDHATPCKKKKHSADPVPVLIYGKGKDNTKRFCESESKKGSLGKIYGKDLMNILIK